MEWSSENLGVRDWPPNIKWGPPSLFHSYGLNIGQILVRVHQTFQERSFISSCSQHRVHHTSSLQVSYPPPSLRIPGYFPVWHTTTFFLVHFTRDTKNTWNTNESLSEYWSLKSYPMCHSVLDSLSLRVTMAPNGVLVKPRKGIQYVVCYGTLISWKSHAAVTPYDFGDSTSSDLRATSV